MTPNLIHLSFILQQLLTLFLAAVPGGRILTNAASGRWEVLKSDIGISAMHMQLMINDRVVMFDRTDFGKSKLALPSGKCRVDPKEKVLKNENRLYCALGRIRLYCTVLTDVWCSNGALTPDGRLIQTGGFNDGDHVVRVFRPCSGCDWEEIGSALARKRWYSTNHILPDGRQIIFVSADSYRYLKGPRRIRADISVGKKSHSVSFVSRYVSVSRPRQRPIHPYRPRRLNRRQR